MEADFCKEIAALESGVFKVIEAVRDFLADTCEQMGALRAADGGSVNGVSDSDA